MTEVFHEVYCSKDVAYFPRVPRARVPPGNHGPLGEYLRGCSSLPCPLSGWCGTRVGAVFPLNRGHFDRGH